MGLDPRLIGGKYKPIQSSDGRQLYQDVTTGQMLTWEQLATQSQQQADRGPTARLSRFADTVGKLGQLPPEPEEWAGKMRSGVVPLGGPGSGAGKFGGSGRLPKMPKSVPKSNVPDIEIPSSVQSNLPPQQPPPVNAPEAAWAKPNYLPNWDFADTGAAVGRESIPYKSRAMTVPAASPNSPGGQPPPYTYSGPSGKAVVPPGRAELPAPGYQPPPPPGRANLSPADIRRAGGQLPPATSGAGPLDAAGSQLGAGMTSDISGGMSRIGRQMAGGAAAGLGVAGYAMSGGDPQSPNSQPAGTMPPSLAEAPGAAQSAAGRFGDALSAGAGNVLDAARASFGSQGPNALQDAQAPDQAMPTPTAGVRAAPRMGGAGGASSNAAGRQPVSFSPNGSGGVRPDFNYYSEMMNAADAGEGYARDFINLREQARSHAIEAAQRNDRFQFVPITDYRNNRIYMVNANGNDVVLDMNDPYHKAEYSRMLEKIGMNPNELSAWSMRASRPLLRSFQPGGGSRDVTPDFNYQPGGAQMGQSQAPGGPMQSPSVDGPVLDLPRPSFTPQPIPERKFGDGFMGTRAEPDADEMGGPSDLDGDYLAKQGQIDDAIASLTAKTSTSKASKASKASKRRR